MILMLDGSAAVKPKPSLSFHKLLCILSHLLDKNHIHSLKGHEHFLKVLKEDFKLMLS